MPKFKRVGIDKRNIAVRAWNDSSAPTPYLMRYLCCYTYILQLFMHTYDSRHQNVSVSFNCNKKTEGAESDYELILTRKVGIISFSLSAISAFCCCKWRVIHEPRNFSNPDLMWQFWIRSNFVQRHKMNDACSLKLTEKNKMDRAHIRTSDYHMGVCKSLTTRYWFVQSQRSIVRPITGKSEFIQESNHHGGTNDTRGPPVGKSIRTSNDTNMKAASFRVLWKRDWRGAIQKWGP